MRAASRIFPITYYIEASRAIMLDGAGLAAVSLDLAVLGRHDRGLPRGGGRALQVGIGPRHSASQAAIYERPGHRPTRN